MTSATSSLALAIALGLSVTTTGRAQDRPDPSEVAAEVHSQGGYAEELRFRGGDGTVGSFPFMPGGGGSSMRGDGRRFDRGAGASGGSDRIAGRGGQGQAPPPQFPSFGGILGGQVVSTVLLVGVVLLLIALLIVVIYALRGDREPPPPVRRPKRVSPSKANADALPWDVGDPDSLAAEGKFSEAILALLVQSLKHVGWRPVGERARTAREVLWSLAFTDPRRSPLSEVVRRAERVRFAGDEANRALFDEVKRWRDAVKAQPVAQPEASA